MNTTQLRKLIDNAPILKTGDKAACETLLKSRTMDLNEMKSGCKRDHILYLMREAERKEQDIMDIVAAA